MADLHKRTIFLIRSGYSLLSQKRVNSDKLPKMIIRVSGT